MFRLIFCIIWVCEFVKGLVLSDLIVGSRREDSSMFALKRVFLPYRAFAVVRLLLMLLALLALFCTHMRKTPTEMWPVSDFLSLCRKSGRRRAPQKSKQATRDRA